MKHAWYKDQEWGTICFGCGIFQHMMNFPDFPIECDGKQWNSRIAEIDEAIDWLVLEKEKILLKRNEVQQ